MSAHACSPECMWSPCPKAGHLVDPAIARARRELHAESKIIDALAPLHPEKRSRVMEAVCILHGLDDLAAEARRMRER